MNTPSDKSFTKLINHIDRLTTRSNELSNRQVTANASGFYNPSNRNKSIRIRETYPVQWSNLSTTSNPKAIPLTLSSWFVSVLGNGAGGVPVTTNALINDLGGVPQWLLTQGSLYNEYRFTVDPVLHWVPAGGTQQSGQIAFGHLRDPNDLFRGQMPGASATYPILNSSSGLPISSTDILTMENSYAGPVSLPFSHRFPLERSRRMNSWMRQDQSLSASQLIPIGPAPATRTSTPSANARLDAPFGAICIQSSVDIFSNTNLGRLFIEYEIEFRSRVIPGLQSSQGTPLSVIGIPSDQLHSGKTFIGIQADSQRETGQKSYKRSTQTVDPISKCKLVASNHLFVGFDLDRIQGKTPLIRLISDKRLEISPVNCSLSLPREEEYQGRFEWNFDLVQTLPYDRVGIDIKSTDLWSGELSWSTS